MIKISSLGGAEEQSRHQEAAGAHRGDSRLPGVLTSAGMSLAAAANVQTAWHSRPDSSLPTDEERLSTFDEQGTKELLAELAVCQQWTLGKGRGPPASSGR